jgi:hypothetical protein
MSTMVHTRKAAPRARLHAATPLRRVTRTRTACPHKLAFGKHFRETRRSPPFPSPERVLACQGNRVILTADHESEDDTAAIQLRTDAPFPLIQVTTRHPSPPPLPPLSFPNCQAACFVRTAKPLHTTIDSSAIEVRRRGASTPGSGGYRLHKRRGIVTTHRACISPLSH